MSIGIPLYYDIALVGFLILFFFIFYKKGFVASFINVFGFVLAFLGGNYLSTIAARKIYDNLIKARLVEYLADQIRQLQSGVIQKFESGLFANLFSTYIRDHALDSDPSNIAESFVSHSIEGGCINIVRIVVFVVIFVLAILIFRMLSGLLEGVNDLPLVGFPNQVLGGAMGLIIGIAIVFILCSFISLILGVWHSDWLNKEVIESSCLFSKLFELNPFYS